MSNFEFLGGCPDAFDDDDNNMDDYADDDWETWQVKLWGVEAGVLLDDLEDIKATLRRAGLQLLNKAQIEDIKNKAVGDYELSRLIGEL